LSQTIESPFNDFLAYVVITVCFILGWKSVPLNRLFIVSLGFFLFSIIRSYDHLCEHYSVIKFAIRNNERFIKISLTFILRFSLYYIIGLFLSFVLYEVANLVHKLGHMVWFRMIPGCKQKRA
jgi:hypothetical protein